MRIKQHFSLRQSYIKKERLEKEYFTCGETIYLFTINTEDHLELYIFTQDTNEQTAEDHYRLEEQMITFENHYNDLKIVQKLIKSGNKYLHQYIAENKHSNSEILTMLLASVKTKKLQKEIQTRLDKISHGAD
ncbi:hypothetical protein [Commensalibacter communis]|uniref:hypothetical protein n=1 Tax=Commensalibacter communis TaxID=2972786 RepID=UPI00232EC2A9|nr:hypothetical protein [Commensalibacter communis]